MNMNYHKATILALVIIPFAAFIAAVVLLWNQYVFASDLILLSVMYIITTLGITVGYHRMLTHEGFKTYSCIRAFFIIAGAMATEGQPISWTATHIRHHAHSDHDDDPHSPLHGFWHAHLGWLFDEKNFEDDTTYAKHLQNDALVQWIDKYTLFWIVLGLAIPFALGGWTGLIWGGGARIFLGTHVTWSVNSICHTFGKRDYETTDESTNNWIIGLLALGEGWHNNHHAFPRNAFHGMEWWQFDVSKYVIWTLEKLGLVWDVQRVEVSTRKSHHERAMKMMLAAKEARDQLTVAINHMRKHLSSMPPSERVASAQKRLTAIHQSVTKAAHMRKQHIQKYVQEVQEMARQLQIVQS